MGILVEDSELDNLYEEWEETLPIHGLSWEIYVARVQLKNVVEWGEIPCMEHLKGVTARKCCGTCIKALKKEAGL